LLRNKLRKKSGVVADLTALVFASKAPLCVAADQLLRIGTIGWFFVGARVVCSTGGRRGISFLRIGTTGSYKKGERQQDTQANSINCFHLTFISLAGSNRSLN
jgi:hypothetical protein